VASRGLGRVLGGLSFELWEGLELCEVVILNGLGASRGCVASWGEGI
jgi:hypothetical protein